MFDHKADFRNILSVLVHCSQDQTFLLLNDVDRGDYWVPSTIIDEKFSWKNNLQFFKKKLFDYEIINEKLLKIVKIWTLEKEFLHLIFEIDLPKEVKTNCKTQSEIGIVVWLTCSQLLKIRTQMRSLEILEITHNYIPNIYRGSEKVSGEVMPMGMLTEIREFDVLLTDDNCENPVHLDLLDSAGIPVEEQYDLYEDYLLLTFPCIYMNIVAFKEYLLKLHFPGEISSLFRAADVWKRGFLTFQDFLLIIAVIEPYAIHYGALGELRCQYIFRYYNKNENGKLNFTELKSLITDICIAKTPDASQIEISKEVDSVIKVLSFKGNSVMTFSQFYNHVLQTRIRDTSLLLRLSVSRTHLRRSDSLRNSFHALSIPSKIVLPTDSTEASGDYKLVLKTILLKPGDAPLEIKDLHFLEDTMTKSVADDLKILSNIKLMRIDNYTLDSKINELLLALKYFCTEICQSPLLCGEFEFEEKEAFSWGSAYLEKLGIILIIMCEQLKEIFCHEPRLLQVESPAYILGDFHGNYHDLMCFEKALWSNGVSLAPAKLIFLGDYVDRGPNGLELIMYLFANKIKNPDKFFLIRGNHEIREIQKLFTFQRECVCKLGSTLGMSVWKAINDTFDTMPLAAVVDNKIFCCHGGVPPPWLCPVISVIDTIPCPLVNCERQSPLAWALMWNDPLKQNVRNSFEELQLLANEGFLPNTQRGTAYIFSCDALDKFLKVNNLSHVIRAHEVVRAGFQVHQKGKLLTVFSSSGYCGGKNFAASILVADKLLRVFMIDTGIN